MAISARLQDIRRSVVFVGMTDHSSEPLRVIRQHMLTLAKTIQTYGWLFDASGWRMTKAAVENPEVFRALMHVARLELGIVKCVWQQDLDEVHSHCMDWQRLRLRPCCGGPSISHYCIVHLSFPQIKLSNSRRLLGTMTWPTLFGCNSYPHRQQRLGRSEGDVRMFQWLETIQTTPDLQARTPIGKLQAT